MTEERSISNPTPAAEPAWFDREVGWIRANGNKARWLAFALLLALIADLAIVAAYSTGPINVFHNDALLLLDDGWRVLNGQVPHRDFHTPLGPAEFIVVGVGMLLSHGSAQGIAIGIAIFGFVLGIWSWLLCRTRMPILFSAAVTAWIALTATCPTPLGFDPRFLSCAMIYNRQGYALLGLILIECAFARETSRFWGGFSTGAALVVLAFLKLNFVGIATLFLVVSFLSRRAELPRLWGLLGGTAAIVAAFVLYLRFSISAFVHDMSFVAHARASSLNLAGLLHGSGVCARSGSFWIVIAATVTLVVVAARQERRESRLNIFVLLSIVVLSSGPLFLQTNSLENRCELASLWIILLLDPITALHLRADTRKLITLVIIAISLGGIAAAAVPEISSTFTLLGYQSSSQKAAGVRVAAPGMENVRFYDSTDLYDHISFGDGDGSHYAATLNDGLNLLQSHSAPDETILALGFHNPFSYLLRRKPAPGGSSYLFVGNSISETYMPPIPWVFDSADLMILPEHEGTHRDSDQFIQNFYRNYLVQNFRPVARSQYWELYRRNR